MPLAGLITAAPPRPLLKPAAASPLVSFNVAAVVVPLLRIARSVTLLPESASVEAEVDVEERLFNLKVIDVRNARLVRV